MQNERDILEQQLADMDRRLLLAQEESLRRGVFLSRMSHEIRTPLSGLIGLLDLAQEEAGTETMTSYLRKMRQLSEHLLELINHLLDLSRIEAGKTVLEEKEFDLRKLADNLSDMFSPQIHRKGLSFTVALEGFADTKVVGDELKLTQILVNFLSNAFKFTEEGEIRLTVSQLRREGNRADLKFSVKDTGIGMEPEFLNRIFMPFEQENAAKDLHPGAKGSGLGMAIADQLVRLMGGEIAVESEPGKGSEFMVYLTMETGTRAGKGPREREKTDQAAEEAVGQEAQAAISLAGKRILLAEDDEINGQVLRDLLTRQGTQADWVKNGAQALEWFGESPENYYDLILMDVQMPALDGREAAKRIRSFPRGDAGQVLIFALSADAFDEEKRRSLASGMDRHLLKPLDVSRLGEEMERAVREREYNGNPVIR